MELTQELVTLLVQIGVIFGISIGAGLVIVHVFWGAFSTIMDYIELGRDYIWEKRKARKRPKGGLSNDDGNTNKESTSA